MGLSLRVCLLVAKLCLQGKQITPALRRAAPGVL